MTWVVINSADLDDYCVGAQTSALRTAALSTGQADRFQKTMVDIANRIRAEVQANPANHISATDNAIPPELKEIACRLILEAMQSGIPGLAMSDDQVRLCNDGREYLRRISERKIAISMPDDPLPNRTVQSSGNSQLIHTGHQHFTHHTLKGL